QCQKNGEGIGQRPRRVGHFNFPPAIADKDKRTRRAVRAAKGTATMNATRFGLKHRPFRATPDSMFYYPATGHEHALAQLLRAVAEDEGLVLLAGAPGTGKTLLAHVLLERLGPDVSSAFLTNTHLPDRTSLLQAVLYDLSLAYEGRSEQELRIRLTD